MAEIHIGRQPIYTRNLNVYAYELMPHTASSNTHEHIKDDKSTSQVIINALIDIGINKLVGKHQAMITLTEQLLQSDFELPLSSDQVIVKIPSYADINNDTVDGCKRLVKAGFKIAIDNYLENPSLHPLSGLAKIIDVNIEDLSPYEIRTQLETLKQSHPVILTDHVKTHDEYKCCREAGATYIQGHFLSRPRIVSGESLDSNQMNIINLLSVLYNPETDADEIVNIISKDITLSYKILQLMNSALFLRATKIESIQQATIMLGRKQLCTWATLMVLSNLDNKPLEQIRISMIRARSCELLAIKANLKPADNYFTVGMFSSLDLLLDRSLEDILVPLPLADSTMTALLNRDGELGAALNCTLAQEGNDWANIKFANLTTDELSSINIEAINWAEDVLENI